MGQGGTVRTVEYEYNFFYGTGNENHQSGTVFFCTPQNSISSYRVLRRMFGPERDEITREWGKLHNEERNNLHMERGEAYKGFWWGNLRERDHLGDPGVDGRIILIWIFRLWDVGDGLDRAGSGWGQVADTCKCGNEPLGSIKCREFLD